MQVLSAKDESVRLFKSDFFEFFSRVHWSVPLILYVPLLSFVVYRGLVLPEFRSAWFLAWVLLGLLSWTLLEYLLHRFLFHYEPRSSFAKRIFFTIHGIHHAYPSDSWRLVMPPVLSIPLAFLFYFGFSALFPAKVFPGFFVGFGCGYLCYDMIHYATHHLPMRGAVGQFLKHYHLRHHFKQDHLGFGVSSPLWDRVFGTWLPK